MQFYGCIVQNFNFIKNSMEMMVAVDEYFKLIFYFKFEEYFTNKSNGSYYITGGRWGGNFG